MNSQILIRIIITFPKLEIDDKILHPNKLWKSSNPEVFLYASAFLWQVLNEQNPFQNFL